MLDPSALLRDRGIQVTAQRLAVLRAVSLEPHISADAVADAVRASQAVCEQVRANLLRLQQERIKRGDERDGSFTRSQRLATPLAITALNPVALASAMASAVGEIPLGRVRCPRRTRVDDELRPFRHHVETRPHHSQFVNQLIKPT